LISAFLVAMITGVSQWCLAPTSDFEVSFKLVDSSKN
jgi:hypothetical protein